MADGGQGFLKLCLTILPSDFDENEDPSNDSGSKYKFTSVKKVILLCVVPECKESYENMELLFRITDVNKIQFLFAADFKLLLITIGLQTSRSSFPCPFCLVPLRIITSSVDEDRSTDGEGHLFEQRTFGLLEADWKQFVDDFSSLKENGKHCHSTVHQSLVVENPAVAVVDKCPPEELHLLQGFVEHTFEGFVGVLGSWEQAVEFPKLLNHKPKQYHGKSFDGNACRDMLRNAEKMMEPQVLRETSPALVLPYVRAYKAMDRLVSGCFGSKPVTDDIITLLQEVIISYMELNLSVTLKMHVIFFHIVPALRNPALKGRGLGMVSGQACEGLHREFLDFWRKYKVTSLDNPRYGDNLLRAVIECSSKHV